MTWLILLPAAGAFWWLLTQPAAPVLRNFYFPVLLLFPLFYQWRPKGLPPMDAAQPVLYVLLVFLLLRHSREFYFSRTDLWLGLFVYGAAISETLTQGFRSGTFQLFADIGSAVLPYLVGKLLIEQYGEREPLLRKMVILLFVVAALSTYEFWTAVNPYHKLLDSLFPGQGREWFVQQRWGYARISGPYGHAILAGMMFLAATTFQVWLLRTGAWGRTQGRSSSRASIGVVLTAGLLAGLYMTQSRGPWAAAPFAFAVSTVGVARRTGRALAIFLVLTAISLSIASPLLKAYTAGTTTEAATQDQQNAVYRRQLLANYTPVVQRGGLWGWGTSRPPIVDGQVSIDNEYLLIALTRGYFGLAMFCLLAGDTIWGLVRRGLHTADRSDRIFVFCLLGVLIGILFLVTTVFMGLQVYALFFLLLGWSQAIGRKNAARFPLFQEVYV